MTAKQYQIKEVFRTLQGEGFHAGTPAMFIRFVGCNLWSGRDETRTRDAERNAARCPTFCDTDFVGGVKMTANELGTMLADAAEEVPLVVLTGGEPLLHVDREFIEAVRTAMPRSKIAVETNGTVLPKVPVGVELGIDWVCVSPKTAEDAIVLRHGHELKVVWPEYDPDSYWPLAHGFEHLFISPCANVERVGVSLVDRDIMSRAAQWAIAHPQWRLSLQTHKLLNIP